LKQFAFDREETSSLTAFLEGSLSERDCLLPNSSRVAILVGGTTLIASCLFPPGNPIGNHQPGQEKIGKASVREKSAIALLKNRQEQE
jgi:hypothetical protein